MKAIADTSSLVQFVRYYLPFDRDGFLHNFIKERVVSGELVILDTVWQECTFTSQGMVVKALPEFRENIVQSAHIQPPSMQKLSNMLDENFSIPQQKRLLSDEGYSACKHAFMQTADYKILVCAMNNQQDQSLFSGQLQVLTEETKLPNDGKVFKKLPAIMDFIGVPTIHIADYLKSYNIDADWFIRQLDN